MLNNSRVWNEITTLKIQKVFEKPHLHAQVKYSDDHDTYKKSVFNMVLVCFTSYLEMHEKVSRGLVP